MISQNDLVQVTREIETTPGTVVGGARSRVYGTAPAISYGGNTITSGINTGDGGVKAVRAGLRYADVNIPTELIFLLNHLEIEDFMRATFPVSELTVGPVSVTFAQNGTHEDGSTGPTIVGTAGDFTSFVNGDVIGCMMETSGASVSAANKRPRPIKALKADGSKIDLEPLYTTGSSGMPSEPLSAQGPVSATFKLGKPIKNKGVQSVRSVNFEFRFTDQASGSYEMVKGCHATGFKLGIDGKGNVTVEISYMGMDYDAPQTTTQGNGTVNANAGINNDQMVSGEDLSYFLVAAVNQLAGDNLTNFSLDGTGTGSGVDDVAGTRFRTGVTLGDIDFTGSLKVYHEHTKMAILASLGRLGSRVPIDWKLVDPAGNFYWFRLPKALLEPGGPTPGQKGNRTDGSFNFKTQLGNGTQRTLIIQAFAAA